MVNFLENLLVHRIDRILNEFNVRILMHCEHFMFSIQSKYLTVICSVKYLNRIQRHEGIPLQAQILFVRCFDQISD